LGRPLQCVSFFCRHAEADQLGNDAGIPCSSTGRPGACAPALLATSRTGVPAAQQGPEGHSTARGSQRQGGAQYFGASSKYRCRGECDRNAQYRVQIGEGVEAMEAAGCVDAEDRRRCLGVGVAPIKHPGFAPVSLCCARAGED